MQISRQRRRRNRRRDDEYFHTLRRQSEATAEANSVSANQQELPQAPESVPSEICRSDPVV
jgi:hypothetical protein